jgi:VanZ family protein
MRIETPPPPALRALCIAAFIAVLVQLFVLDEPQFVKTLTNVTWDKACHAAAYGSFAMLLWIGIGFRWSLGNWLGVVAVGALDEFHQLFVPGRDSEVLDVVADAVGAAIVTCILYRLSKRAPRRPEKKEPTEGSRRAPGQAGSRACVAR